MFFSRTAELRLNPEHRRRRRRRKLQSGKELISCCCLSHFGERSNASKGVFPAPEYVCGSAAVVAATVDVSLIAVVAATAAAAAAAVVVVVVADVSLTAVVLL